jgi:fucose 4-O-acetylase-like acetyltransferase
MKPYFFTLFLIYAGSLSFGKMGFQMALGRIVKAMYGTGRYIDWVQLWFLPHLFVVSLYAFLFYALFKRFNNRIVTWTALFLTLAVSSLFLKSFYPFSISLAGKSYELFGLPYSLDLTLLSGFFFILGSEIRQFSSDEVFGNIWVFIGTVIGIILLNIFVTAKIDFNTRTYESFVWDTIEALTGIAFILALSRQLELHTNKLASLFKYLGRISLIILIFHVPIQDFWGQKVRGVTDNIPLSIWVGFFMGVLGPILIYELFIKRNPVASFWFGREAEKPRSELSQKEQELAPAPVASEDNPVR